MSQCVIQKNGCYVTILKRLSMA